MRQYITVTCIALLFFIGLAAEAQDGVVANELSRLQAAYRQPAPLSFSIKYLYSDQDAPATVRDSVTGQYKTRGSRFWGVLNNAEYLSNNEYFLVVYPGSSIMMLDKADTNQQPFVLDSFIKEVGSFQASSLSSGHIRLSMAEHPLIQSVDFWYNPTTYLLDKMEYQTRATDDEEEMKAGIVRILFSDYNAQPFDETLLDAKRYFQKKGKVFTPSSRYEGFTIHLASTNLQN